MRRRFYWVFFLLFIGFGAFAATGLVVSQKGKVFNPNKITLKVGQVLRIANDDRVLHHVYIESDSFNFDSGEQPPGRTVEIQFDSSGTFEVLCAIHPKMRLVVTVE